MTIYVDDAAIPAKVFNPSTNRTVEAVWYHLFSDEIDPDELHAFAQTLGLRRSYFQKGSVGIRPAPWKDHYDVISRKKTLALQYGAEFVTREEAVKIWQAKRDKFLSIQQIPTDTDT